MMGSRKTNEAGTANPAAQDPATNLPGEAGSEAPAAPVIPTMVEIIAGLLADEGFVALVVSHLPKPAELVPSLLSSEDFVKGINSHIDIRLDGDLPELTLADDDFGLGLKSLVDSHLDTVLPDRVAAAMPKAEPIASAPVESAAVSETVIDRTSREQAAAQKAAVKAAEKQAEQRREGKQRARDSFVSLISTVPDVVEPIDLSTMTGGALVVDDGTAFSIDFSKPIAPIDLSLDDNGAVRLRHEAISIGDGMDESFPVKGVSLVLQGEEGMRAVRCEMPSTLMVGGGQRAQLGADSLIFRIPR